MLVHEPLIPINSGDTLILNPENLVLIIGYTIKYPSICRSVFVETIVILHVLHSVLGFYPTICFFLIIYMPILELIIELLDSFNLPNPNSTEFITSDVPDLPKDLKPTTVSDLKDCAKAHSKIEKGGGKNITSFVSYAKKVNKANGRKTTASFNTFL